MVFLPQTSCQPIFSHIWIAYDFSKETFWVLKRAFPRVLWNLSIFKILSGNVWLFALYKVSVFWKNIKKKKDLAAIHSDVFSHSLSRFRSVKMAHAEVISAFLYLLAKCPQFGMLRVVEQCAWLGLFCSAIDGRLSVSQRLDLPHFPSPRSEFLISLRF